MTPDIFVRPASPALKIRDPAGGHLFAAGSAVTPCAYWRRRLADGDVVETLPAGPRMPADQTTQEQK
jgi:hypothetical protein